MKKITALMIPLIAHVGLAHAEPLAALTSTNRLIRFNSVSPGTLASDVAITGLTAGDALVGIDVRPLNGVLYGFAVDSGPGGANAGVGRVYSINLSTGAATVASTIAPDPADVTAPLPSSTVTGTSFGVDFNPVADRLRVVSDTGQNLRINVATGLTQFDVALNYIAGDPNVGTPPAAVAAAYTNSIAGAMTTLLYDLDSSISSLVTQNPPNNGTLNTVGLSSAAVFADSAFDISGKTGVGYVVLDGVTLGSINLTTAVVTELGAIGTRGSITGVAVVVPEPSGDLLAALACAGLAAIVVRTRQRRTGAALTA
jgi:hypothetical protein